MKKRILILEDDALTISLYQFILKDYQLIIARTISEAVFHVENNPPYDLYIVDVHIHGSRFNGFDFVNLMKDENILICTAFNLDFAIENKYKGHQYIRKPISDVKEFKNKIKKLLQENQET